MSGSVGIDIGTNSLVSAMFGEDGSPIFKMERDCFFRLIPKTEVNRQSIKLSLDKRGSSYIIDEDGSYVIVGQDALEIAIERNDIVQRPMSKGIISPREKSALPMLKLLIESLIGKGEQGDVCIFSIPASPVDGNFDITYHSEILSHYIRQLGYNAQPINEAFAIAVSELLDDGLTGITMSFGAGMTNICMVSEGDPLVEFSMIKGGDFIDQSVGNALDLSYSLVQMEKEAGTDLNNPSSKIMEAVSVYYSSLMNYIFKNIAHELKVREKQLPNFRHPIPIVVSGGLTLAEGFVQKATTLINNVEFPFEIGEVKRADQPMKAVANGALLASML